MILRNKSINATAKNVQLSVSYGEADVKEIMQRLFNDCLGLDLEKKLSMPWTEQDFIYTFTNDPKCFANYQGKWAEMLAQWCFNTALRLDMIKKSVVVENCYYFTEKCVIRHRGRPAKQ